MKVADLREREEDLGFRPEDAVRWLSPRELWRAGVKVVLSSVFASYADKREVQEALEPTELKVPPSGGELWLDFVADLGDGFDATCTVAGLLAADRLEPEPPSGGEPVGPLPRASVLVLGGDEVYPTASAQEYDNRMKGPYRAALPDARDAPSMFVLPGNHDWYDGLTSFLRVFAQGRSIGGWRTRQNRSYFAVQLPNRWWLVGLDTQFGSELDAPQLRYFTSFLTAKLEPGDSVILCCATPTWVKSADKEHRDAFNSLHWFERNYIRTRHDDESALIEQTGASVRLWITGDSHHYARFAERLSSDEDAEPDTAAQETGAEPVLSPDPQRRQMVTCGLGGAYLSATHDLPEMLPLPPEKSRVLQKGEEPTHFARADTCYPDRDTSTRLSRRLAQPWSRYWLPVRNPGFGNMAAGVHVVLLLALSSLLGLVGDRTPVAAVRAATLGATFTLCVRVTIIVTAVLLLPLALRFLRSLVPKSRRRKLRPRPAPSPPSSCSCWSRRACCSRWWPPTCPGWDRAGWSCSARPSRRPSAGCSAARRSRCTCCSPGTARRSAGRCRGRRSKTARASSGCTSPPTARSPCTRWWSTRCATTGSWTRARSGHGRCRRRVCRCRGCWKRRS